MNQLTSEGIAFSYQPQIDRQGILSLLANGATGLVIRSKTTVDEELLAASPALKFVARGGAGMDNVDEVASNRLGIRCFNAGEANSVAVGEHAIGMLLSLIRNISRADAQVRQGIWLREENRGIELNGRTVGIIGYGNTGSAFARLLSGFGMKVLAYDKYKKGFGNEYVTECGMEEIHSHAEILSLHVPLDCHTKFMVNSDFLQQFVRNILLINTSRGEVVKTADVIDCLNSGKVAGFAADVLENEPPARNGASGGAWFEQLKIRPNVVLTPHIAGWTVESYQKISEVLAQRIRELRIEGVI